MAPLPDIGDLFKSLVWDALIAAAKTALFSAVPWLGWGPIGVLVGMVISIFAEKLYDLAKGVIDFKLIAFKNEEHRRAFDSAEVKLKIIARDKGLESPEFKEARSVNAAALSKFIHWAS